jgi:caffeoyl-CoA O-methyltransferase
VKTDESWIPTEQDLAFIEASAGDPHAVLVGIETAAEPDGIPILDRASGRLLGVLAAGRRRIVEVGTAIGYSTLCMALAMPDDGTIVTIDPDEGRTTIARGFWRRAGIADTRIEVVNAPALEALGSGAGPADPRLDGPFDLAFIDALKNEYQAYVEALVPRLSPGALVVADNVLRSGQVSGARAELPGWQGGNQAIRAFDRAMHDDPRFRTTILPVGDGLLVAVLVGGAAS